MKTFEIDGMTVYYGLPEEVKKGDYFYLPFEAMSKYVIGNSKRVEGYVGVYRWMGGGEEDES